MLWHTTIFELHGVFIPTTKSDGITKKLRDLLCSVGESKEDFELSSRPKSTVPHDTRYKTLGDSVEEGSLTSLWDPVERSKFRTPISMYCAK